jgi:hypothetical protein
MGSGRPFKRCKLIPTIDTGSDRWYPIVTLRESSFRLCTPRGTPMLADLAAACMLLLSIYAQWSVPSQTDGEGRVLFARLLLAAVGTAIGLFAVQFAQLGDLRDTSAIALFLIGFGQVHAPAAVILFLKAQRAEGLS